MSRTKHAVCCLDVPGTGRSPVLLDRRVHLGFSPSSAWAASTVKPIRRLNETFIAFLPTCIGENQPSMITPAQQRLDRLTDSIRRLSSFQPCWAHERRRDSRLTRDQ